MTEHEHAHEAVRTADSAASRLFDLRTVIAVLFGIYGVVLTIMGIVATSDAEITRAGNINLNLWSGIFMLILSALFATWAFLRPLQLPTEEELAAAPDLEGPAHGH